MSATPPRARRAPGPKARLATLPARWCHLDRIAGPRPAAPAVAARRLTSSPRSSPRSSSTASCGPPSADSPGCRSTASSRASGRPGRSARAAATRTSSRRPHESTSSGSRGPTVGRARAIALPPSPPIHQLATHDLLAAFLRTCGPDGAARASSPGSPNGLRASCSAAIVRPDAIAGVRVGDRAIVLFIERDLGTERGEVLPGKIRRYRSLFAARSRLALSVGFVVESGRRERSIQHQRPPVADRAPNADHHRRTAYGRPASARTGPMGSRPSRPADSRHYGDTDASLLTAGCLADPDALAAFDDRAAQAMSVLRPYLR